MRQDQFLEVVERDEAERRWAGAIRLQALPSETVPLAAALGRVLAEDVVAPIDVPGFDRSNLDGYAVRAEDTVGATEERPVRLRPSGETVTPGHRPAIEVGSGEATAIATGGMLPRGADAVVPVEDTDADGHGLEIRSPRAPGAGVSHAGTDLGRGETALFAGTLLTSRETGVLAALGCDAVAVVRRPRVAVISTGDELVPPGGEMAPGLIFDSNGRILADALRELGAEPRPYDTVADDEAALAAAVSSALAECDAVVLSGGTSKGEGDLCYRVVAALDPGIVVHGVALKPGKPVCLAADDGKPVAVLPGFPTSAIFTFHELVAPVLRRLAGLPAAAPRAVRRARLATSVRSERGRLEYVLVGLVEDDGGRLAAYPMGSGSGSVTTFSRADGFVRLGRRVERADEGDEVDVTLLAAGIEPADLVIIGSHCVGLDRIAAFLVRRGFRVKLLAAGSRGGLEAARRGECDVAPIHLLDEATAEYNTPFLDAGLELVEGYRRWQGVVTRADDGRGIEDLLADPGCRMVHRNRGSGTR
ncbi:MAG: molybdopterin biosynthesis protein, partial [Thermoanaerobaculia bacterium]|nr:molybdopterin biosynthesis protein [Thermoanaerobaculia bacterium]